MSVIQALIVDDSISQRMVLKGKLAQYENIEIIGEAKDGREALQKYLELSPDVVILDLVMPKFDGKSALKKIIEHDEKANVIIASSLGGQEDIEECIRLGAKSFVQKPYDDEDLVRAIEEITAE